MDLRCADTHKNMLPYKLYSVAAVCMKAILGPGNSRQNGRLGIQHGKWMQMT